jgi:hypothetical protein
MVALTAALMQRIKTEGAFNTLADLLADASELVYRLDTETAETAEDKLARSKAFDEATEICDGLVEALALLPSDGIGSAVVYVLLASDFLSRAVSWADHEERSEKGEATLRETTKAAARCIEFALPALLALREAGLARRIGRRYLTHEMYDQAQRDGRASP